MPCLEFGRHKFLASAIAATSVTNWRSPKGSPVIVTRTLTCYLQSTCT